MGLAVIPSNVGTGLSLLLSFVAEKKEGRKMSFENDFHVLFRLRFSPPDKLTPDKITGNRTKISCRNNF
ncbi:MAG: hypothetical protein PF590_07230 [Candidatus Delongbacteria bacterium]|jgi:hypothetical protein|nr:hypothetical protein [Candidatus Delongbacteria bacterium]